MAGELEIKKIFNDKVKPFILKDLPEILKRIEAVEEAVSNLLSEPAASSKEITKTEVKKPPATKKEPKKSPKKKATKKSKPDKPK